MSIEPWLPIINSVAGACLTVLFGYLHVKNANAADIAQTLVQDAWVEISRLKAAHATIAAKVEGPKP